MNYIIGLMMAVKMRGIMHNGSMFQKNLRQRILFLRESYLMKKNILCLRGIKTKIIHQTKAEAIGNMLNGEVTVDCPASILTTHEDAYLYTDRDAAARIL